MSSTKRVFLTFFACFVLLFSFLVPVSAVTDPEPITYNFAVPDPSTNFDGYIVLPRLDEQATLVAWYITPQTSHDEFQVYDYDIEVNVHVASNRVEIDFVSTEPNAKFLVTTFYIYDGTYNNISYLEGKLVEYGNPSTVYLNTSSKFVGTNYFKNITRLTHDEYDEYYIFNSRDIYCVYSNEYPEYKQLEQINTHFMNTISKLNLTNEQLSEVLSLLNNLYDSVVNIDGTLSEFVYYYWEEFTLNQLPEQFAAVCSRLDNIYRLLSKFEWGEITTAFSEDLVSEFDDVEGNINDHLDNPELESFFDGVQVDTSTGAFAFIWNLITSCFNSHPEVLGLVSTILAFGLIALILNR